MRYDTTGDLLGLAMMLLHLIVSTISPIVFAVILLKVSRGTIRNKFSPLMESLKENKLTSLLLTPIDLFRTYLTCVILTTVR